MSEVTQYQVWHGHDCPPPQLRELRAGPVTAMLDGIDLRYVRYGSVEIIRRIYVAVRDPDWNTIVGSHRIRKIDQSNDRFTIEFEVMHEKDEIKFIWKGQITGTADGTIRYAMDGEALSDFQYNRIGFCVLYPDENYAGKPYKRKSASGESHGRLPERIGVQGFENGKFIALMEPFDQISIQLEEHLSVQFDHSGDLFEIEDQRNWVDASFKCYCTPLALGFPHSIAQGGDVFQSVTTSVEAKPNFVLAEYSEEHALELGHCLAVKLPAIGFGLTNRHKPLTSREIELLRLTGADHLRIDLHLNDPEYKAIMKRGIQASSDLACALEIALHVSEHPAEQLETMAQLLDGNIRVSRFLVHAEGAQTTTAAETTPVHLIDLVREKLIACAPDADFVGGTDMNFAELNRTRPDISYCDAICYSINAQVHAFDDLSMNETFSGQSETVRSARAFSGDLPIVVSPITLKRRSNPYATRQRTGSEADVMPETVDPRQLSLYGAVWTLGSIKALAEQGADSLTYYETTGWLGLMEDPEGSPLPYQFPSSPGMIFPVYAVFTELAKRKEAELIAFPSSHPLDIVGLAMRDGKEILMLVGNLTGVRQEVRVRSLQGKAANVRLLDDIQVGAFQTDPVGFRQSGTQHQIVDGQLKLTMNPYCLASVTVSI